MSEREKFWSKDQDEEKRRVEQERERRSVEQRKQEEDRKKREEKENEARELQVRFTLYIRTLPTYFILNEVGN